MSYTVFSKATSEKIPDPFTVSNGERAYQFSVIGGQTGLYKINAVAFDYIKSAGDLGSRLLGEPPSKGYWKQQRIIQNLTIIKNPGTEAEKRFCVQEDALENVTRNFNFLFQKLQEKETSIKDLGQHLLIQIDDF